MSRDWSNITDAELKRLSPEELEELCSAMRDRILRSVAANGGHLASNLGSVELITAIHRVFSLADEPLVFDVGHQAYAHKLLSGRWRDFDSLRQFGGLCGFPSPEESPCDTGVSGHAGSAISLAAGIAAARRRQGDSRKVIALVGDGTLTNGIALEGLNNAAAAGANLVVILNDNKMAISRNVGSMSRCLNRVISGGSYNRFKNVLRQLVVTRHQNLHRYIRRVENSLKSSLLPPESLFQNLGLRYIGPIDGHSLPDLLRTLERVRSLDEPVLVHVLTEKGHGCSFAAADPQRYHGVGGFSLPDGTLKCSRRGFSAALGDKMLELARSNPEIDVVTPAMLPGAGLTEFAQLHPWRCYDVGIAEEHSVIFAAGLAIAGRHPLCAMYATFAQRALDCIYHDVVLAKLPVVFTFDRAGVVEDGPTHHGIYDLGFLRAMPGLEILAPCCEAELARMLDYAFVQHGPVVIRYPRGAGAGVTLPAEPVVRGRSVVLRDGAGPVIWAMGPEVKLALEIAPAFDAVVVCARFIAPFDRELALRFADRPMATIENHALSGGLGAALDEALAGVAHAPVRHYGWPGEPIPFGSEAQLRERYGLTAPQIGADLAHKWKGIIS